MNRKSFGFYGLQKSFEIYSLKSNETHISITKTRDNINFRSTQLYKVINILLIHHWLAIWNVTNILMLLLSFSYTN